MTAVFGKEGVIPRHPKLRANGSVLRPSTTRKEKEKFSEGVAKKFNETSIETRLCNIEKSIQDRAQHRGLNLDDDTWKKKCNEEKEILMVEACNHIVSSEKT